MLLKPLPHTSSLLNCSFYLKDYHCTVTLTKSSVTAMLWNKVHWEINWNFQRDTLEGRVLWKTLCGRGVDIVCQEHCVLFNPSDGPCAWIVITCESEAGLSCPTMNSTHHHLDDKSLPTLASGWTRKIYYWSLNFRSTNTEDRLLNGILKTINFNTDKTYFSLIVSAKYWQLHNFNG